MIKNDALQIRLNNFKNNKPIENPRNEDFLITDNLKNQKPSNLDSNFNTPKLELDANLQKQIDSYNNYNFKNQIDYFNYIEELFKPLAKIYSFGYTVKILLFPTINFWGVTAIGISLYTIYNLIRKFSKK